MIIKIILIDDRTNEVIDKRLIIHHKSIDCFKIAKSYLTKKMLGSE